MGQGDKSERLGGSRQRGQRKKQRDVRASGGRLHKGKLKGWRSQLGRRGVARRGLWTRADLGSQPGSAARQLHDPAVPTPRPGRRPRIPETRRATAPVPREQMHARHSAQDPASGGPR